MAFMTTVPMRASSRLKQLNTILVAAWMVGHLVAAEDRPPVRTTTTLSGAGPAVVSSSARPDPAVDAPSLYLPAPGQGIFPSPVYPRKAIESGLSGTVYLGINVQKGGLPDTVAVIQSSGHKVLDDAARNTVLKEWRFPSGAPDYVEVPIQFRRIDTNSPAGAAQGKTATPAAPSNSKAPDSVGPGRGKASYERPQPPYPPQLLKAGKGGVVTLLVSLGQDGHPSEVAVLKSSGFKEFDESAQKTVLKQWRFPPSSPPRLQVPIEFNPESTTNK
jgi:TonB family protein